MVSFGTGNRTLLVKVISSGHISRACSHRFTNTSPLQADMDAFQKHWEQRTASCSGGTANFLHCQEMDGDEYLLTFRQESDIVHEYSVVGCSAVIVKFQAQPGDILVFASKDDGSVVVCTHRLKSSAFQRSPTVQERENVLQERSRNVLDPPGVYRTL
jgi:hypothetical protein